MTQTLKLRNNTFPAKYMDLYNTILSEGSQRRTNSLGYHFWVEPKINKNDSPNKSKLNNTASKVVVSYITEKVGLRKEKIRMLWFIYIYGNKYTHTYIYIRISTRT